MEIEYVEISDLKFAEYNPRHLSDEQFNQIKDSLERFGFVDPVIRNVNPDRYNIVVGGEQRCRVFQKMGGQKVPCYSVNLNETEEKELNVRLNKNTGEWDFGLLEDYFSADDLLDWGFKEEELPFVDSDEEPDFDESSLDEQYQNYKNNSIKQIVLFYEGDMYERTLKRLEDVGKAYDLDNNSEIVLKLLDFFENNSK